MHSIGDIIRHAASTALDWAPLISAIVVTISLVVALWKVVKKRAKRTDATRSARPYFMFEEYPKSRTWRQADGRLGIRVTLKNLGPHAAANLSLRVGLVDCRLDRPPLYEWRGNSTQVPSGEEVSLEESGVSVAAQMPSHFLFAEIRYGDPMTGQPYCQFFVHLWRGISGGKVSDTFRAVSESERGKVKQAVSGCTP
jgi:hypothetical protein